MKLRRPSISVIIFILLLASITYSVRKSNRQNARSIEQANQLKQQGARINVLLVTIKDNQARIKASTEQVKALTTLIQDCIPGPEDQPQGQCYAQSVARQMAFFAAQKETLERQHAAQVRQLARTRTQVEQKVTEKATETKTTVESKAEEVKQKVEDVPVMPQAPNCALNLGELGVICSVPVVPTPSPSPVGGQP